MLYIYDSCREDALDDYCRVITATNEFRKRGLVPNIIKGKSELKKLKGDYQDYLLIPFSFHFDLYEVILYCNSKKIPVLTVHSYSDYFQNCVYTTVSRDSFRCMQTTLAYLIYNTKSEPKIAFWGTTPRAYADRAKIDSLYSLYSPMQEEDIYFNSKNFLECFERFFEAREKYDAVICANSYIAVAFIKRFNEIDPEYLRKVSVVTFSETEISKLFYTSVTVIEYPKDSIYNSLINAYKTLRKNHCISSINIKIENEILIRESSGQKMPNYNEIYELTSPFYIRNRFPKYAVNEENFTEYVNDPYLKDIVAIERLLFDMDIIGLKIILLFLKGAKNIDISNEIFISIQAILYRSKRMFKVVGVEKKKDFIDILSQYISIEKLSRYISEKEVQDKEYSK